MLMVVIWFEFIVQEPEITKKIKYFIVDIPSTLTTIISISRCCQSLLRLFVSIQNATEIVCRLMRIRGPFSQSILVG